MIRRTFLALLAVVVVAGCSDGSGPSGIDGRYNLETIDGTKMPYSETDGTSTVTLTSGYININTDGTFTVGFSFTVKSGSTTVSDSDTDLGTWVRNNNAIQFNYSDGSTDVASLNGNLLTLTSEGSVFTFRK